MRGEGANNSHFVPQHLCQEGRESVQESCARRRKQSRLAPQKIGWATRLKQHRLLPLLSKTTLIEEAGEHMRRRGGKSLLGGLYAHVQTQKTLLCSKDAKSAI